MITVPFTVEVLFQVIYLSGIGLDFSLIFASWWCDSGMEDPAITGQCYDTHEPEASMSYQQNLAYESDTYFTGYPRNVNLPAVTVSHLGIIPSGGDASYELRPAKQSKATSSRKSFFPGQQRFSSKVSTPPSFYVPNSQEKLQDQPPENNYFASFYEVKDGETYAPTTGSIEAETVGSGGYNHMCISDINCYHVDAFNVSPGQLLEVGHGSDMRISGVSAENRNSGILAKRASGHTHNHVMVERKRREKLSQRFIALSAIIPGLKKTDKATVLGDAIKYVKQLQDKIKALEEQAPKRTAQPVVYVKKTELYIDDKEDSSSSEDVTDHVSPSSNKDVTETGLTTEIETRVVDRNVLIHIHCGKRKNLLLNFLAELEKLQLAVVNASLLSFSETTFDLIFNALMEEGCDLTVKDIVKAVQALLKKTT